jgi:hypothetical protein
MFAAYCPRHQSKILLSTDAITALIRTEDGLLAHFVCTCGEPGTWIPPRLRA